MKSIIVHHPGIKRYIKRKDPTLRVSKDFLFTCELLLAGRINNAIQAAKSRKHKTLNGDHLRTNPGSMKG